MDVLIACEFSGIVREEFRKLGHNAYSCDLLPADDYQTWHIQGDVREIVGAINALTSKTRRQFCVSP